MKQFFADGRFRILLLLAFLMLEGPVAAAELRLTEPSIERGKIVLVAAVDFEKSNLAKVNYNERTKQIFITRENVTLVISIGTLSAKLNGAAVKMPLAAELVKGHAMVPAGFVLEALGLSGTSIVKPTIEPGPRLQQPKLSGRVLLAGRPLSGIILRLVRAEDFSFVPDIRVRSDSDGNYAFQEPAAGAYRVYAYVGDNAGYFNRVTPTIQVGGRPAKAEDINMGRILEPKEPPRGAILAPNRDMVFSWTDCPRTFRYHLSVIEPATNEEVFSTETATAYATIPISKLTSGHLYEWRVTASDTNGVFVGGSPGAGTDPFTFSLDTD